MSLTVKANTKENKHNCNVSSVICHSDLVISGSDDGKIKIIKSFFVGVTGIRICILRSLKSRVGYSCKRLINEGSGLQIWKPSLELVSELEAPGGILSLAAIDNILYTCTTAETVQSWDLNEAGKSIGQLSSTLFQPQKLYTDKGTKILWAGDAQGNVAKYENSKECGKYELVEEIWDLMVSSSPPLIYTARDRDVVVCELVTGTTSTRAVVKSTLEGRSPFCIAGHRLCFFDRDGRKIFIHENNLEKKFPRLSDIPASELIINAIAAASDNAIYTGGYDSTVKKWDLCDLRCMGSVNLNSCINAIAVRSENEAFVATSDGYISLIGA